MEGKNGGGTETWAATKVMKGIGTTTLFDEDTATARLWAVVPRVKWPAIPLGRCIGGGRVEDRRSDDCHEIKEAGGSAQKR